MRPRLLVLEPVEFSQTALDRLSAVFDLSFGPLTRRELCEQIGAFEAVFIRLGHRIDAEVLGQASQLRFIASPTTGLNHIDVAAAEARDVTILSLGGESAFLDDVHATAEHSWALLLALIRKLPSAHESVKRGEWDRDRFRGRELHGRTLGVIGCGRLGSKVAAYGRAFGMTVIAADPMASLPDWIGRDSLDAVASRADVLSIHVPYGPETHRLIDERILLRMKPGSLLINTARGEVIDEGALLRRLEEGVLAGAALDVLCAENESGEAQETAAALRTYAASHDNLIITPHIGGATRESMEKTEIFIAERLITACGRESLRIDVPPGRKP